MTSYYALHKPYQRPEPRRREQPYLWRVDTEQPDGRKTTTVHRTYTQALRAVPSCADCGGPLTCKHPYGADLRPINASDAHALLQAGRAVAL